MKNYFLFALRFIVALLTSSPLAFSGPVIVGNPAGEGEYSVVFVHAQFNKILEECLNVSCVLSSEERLVLANVLANLMSGRHTLPTPLFKNSEVLGNKLFEVHQLQNRRQVWINRDLLWQDPLKTSPYNLGDGIVLWLEILKTTFQLPEDKIAAISQKLKQSLTQKTQRGRLEFKSLATVEFILWNREMSDALVVRDPQLDSLDLTPLVSKILRCPKPVTPRFFSPALLALPYSSGQKPGITLQFGVRWNCEGKSYSSRGIMSVRMKDLDAASSFDAATFYLQVEQGAFFEK